MALCENNKICMYKIILLSVFISSLTDDFVFPTYCIYWQLWRKEKGNNSRYRHPWRGLLSLVCGVRDGSRVLICLNFPNRTSSATSLTKMASLSLLPDDITLVAWLGQGISQRRRQQGYNVKWQMTSMSNDVKSTLENDVIINLWIIRVIHISPPPLSSGVWNVVLDWIVTNLNIWIHVDPDIQMSQKHA